MKIISKRFWTKTILRRYNPLYHIFCLFFPNILDRYLIKSLFPYFVFCVVVFSFVNFIKYLTEFTDTAVKYGAPMTTVLKTVLYLIPFLITFTISIGLLISIILTIEKLNSHNEVIGLKTSGLSLPQIFKPILILGVFVFIFQICFFQWILPWGNKNFIIQKYRLLNYNPLAEIQKNLHIQDGSKEIKVESVSDNTLYGVSLIDSKNNTIYYALTGSMEPLLNQNAFKIELHNVSSVPYSLDLQDHPLQTDLKYFHQLEFLLHFSNSNDESVVSGEVEIKNLTTLYQDIRKEWLKNISNAITQFHFYIRSQYQVLKKNTLKASHEMQIQKQNWKQLREKTYPFSQMFIFQRKLAFAVSSIIMAIIAMPLTMVKQRRGKNLSIAFCIGIVFVYNVLIIIVNILNNEFNINPILAAWIPNLVIICLLAILSLFIKLKNR